MSFLPDEEVKGQIGLNMAPMIDFLFLMLMFFACLSITRMATRDTHIDLVEVKPEQSSSIARGDEELNVVNISILTDGQYRWVTDIRDYPMATADELRDELQQQYRKGLFPKSKQQTQVLLKIDREARWQPILQAIFAIREAGFEAYPVYEPTDAGISTL